MSCRLCLGAEILIPIYDDKGIAAAVAMYTGVQLGVEHKICVRCWACVDNFRTFCRLVAEKQRELLQQEAATAEQTEDIVVKDSYKESQRMHAENSMQQTLVESGEKQQKRKSHRLLKKNANEMVHITKLEQRVNSDEQKQEKLQHEECQPDDAYRNEIEIEFRVVDECVELKNCADPNMRQVRDALAEAHTIAAQNEAEEEEIAKNVNTVRIKKPRARPHKCQTIKETKQDTTNRESNARKRGRPCRSDASVVLAEDGLIARHMQLVCELCKETVNTFFELKQHFQQAHQMNGYAVCCNKRLHKRGVLIDHINVHKNPDYFKCSHCVTNFADRVCLRNHLLLKHQTADELPYQCEHCDKKFAKAYFLHRHALHHTAEEQRTFLCQHCKKGYPSSSRLNTHLKNVHGDGSLKVCNHCGIFVRGKNTFERHLAQHEGKTSLQGVQCQVCGQRLSDKYCLRLHMELHEDKRSYVCAICGKDAPSRLALNAHHRYHHAKVEVLHKCEHCDKAFKTPRALREHITTHTGETLYSCPYCGKKFKCSSNLHAHRKRQHPADWERDRQPCRASNPL